MKALVTGSAGFIGFHVARRLLADGHEVLGYDGMTPYYDPALKEQRNALLEAWIGFRLVRGLLEDKSLLDATVAAFKPDAIIHLAAQAGVRYSIERPDSYIQSNLVGTANLLEAARANRPAHMLIASTSSVYGGNESSPFCEADRTDFPVSLYAATKKACEAMSHAYASLYDIPTTCFRFFTVYGPWGRPDMALFKFVSAIENAMPIDIYGEGRMRRDFTYVDDLVEAVVRLIDVRPRVGFPAIYASGSDSLSPVAPWRSVNIAGGNPVELMTFIKTIENVLCRPAKKNLLPMQPGDVVETSADAGLLEALTGFRPKVDIEQGVKDFVTWYRDWSSSVK